MAPIEKNARTSLCELEISNFFHLKVHVCTVDHNSFISLYGILLSGSSFSYGHLYGTTTTPLKKNRVWKNMIYSITNQYIDLIFLGDMNWSMARIFVTANFSGKCLLMGATFNF